MFTKTPHPIPVPLTAMHPTNATWYPPDYLTFQNFCPFNRPPNIFVNQDISEPWEIMSHAASTPQFGIFPHLGREAVLTDREFKPPLYDNDKSLMALSGIRLQRYTDEIRIIPFGKKGD
jgi:hypothetical protein